MITLQLEHDAQQALIEALDSYLGDLRYEIGNTDSKDFRDTLKEKKALLNDTLIKLKEGAVAA